MRILEIASDKTNKQRDTRANKEQNQALIHRIQSHGIQVEERKDGGVEGRKEGVNTKRRTRTERFKWIISLSRENTRLLFDSNSCVCRMNCLARA